MAMPNMDVQVTFDAWNNESEDPQGDAPSEPLSMTRRIVGAATSRLGAQLETREFTVRFASDEEVCALNRKFRNKNAPTNVLSFPAGDMPGQEDPSLGDIILAHETVTREAAEQGKSFTDHTMHLILHGILHLLGYEHDTDELAAEMETLEREILRQLSIADPYLEAAHVS